MADFKRISNCNSFLTGLFFRRCSAGWCMLVACSSVQACAIIEQFPTYRDHTQPKFLKICQRSSLFFNLFDNKFIIPAWAISHVLRSYPTKFPQNLQTQHIQIPFDPLMINLSYLQAITRPIQIITWHRSSTLSVDQKVKSSLKKKLMWIYFIILYFILGKTWNCGKLNIWTWKYLSLKGKFNQVFLLLEFVQFTRFKMRLR